MTNAKRWGVVLCIASALSVSIAFAFSPRLVMLTRVKGTTFKIDAVRGNGSIKFDNFSGNVYTNDYTIAPRVVIRQNSDNYQYVNVNITLPDKTTYVARMVYSVTRGEMTCEVLDPKPDPAKIEITTRPESCWILVK